MSGPSAVIISMQRVCTPFAPGARALINEDALIMSARSVQKHGIFATHDAGWPGTSAFLQFVTCEGKNGELDFRLCCDNDPQPATLWLFVINEHYLKAADGTECACMFACRHVSSVWLARVSFFEVEPLSAGKLELFTSDLSEERTWLTHTHRCSGRSS
jgi:hypothetical protein